MCEDLDEFDVELGSAAHILHDERLNFLIGEKRIPKEVFLKKAPSCFKDCFCGALLTMEDKVAQALTEIESKKLNEKLELLTSSYYQKCQSRIKLNCESKMVQKLFEIKKEAFSE